MTVISIITSDDSFEKVIASELVGLDHEIIIDNWESGFDRASGKFVCFLERDSDYRPGMFIRGVVDMLIKPGYAKLGMVSPAVEVLTGEEMVFGFNIDDNGLIFPVRKPKSLEPYLAQVGYFPGSVIRYTALDGYRRGLKDMNLPLQLSADFSMHLWNNGQRLHIDPKMVYQIDTIQQAVRPRKSKPSAEAKKIWHRESV